MEMIAYITNDNQLYYAPDNEPQENKRATPEQIIMWNEKINLENEITQLKSWFDIDYARKEQKLRRLHTLYQSGVISTEDARNAYSNLISLYNEAETKRQRIQEIEGNL